MEFRSISKLTVMQNPQKDMKERRVPSEIRTEPLTGRTARICHFMALKWPPADLAAITAGTETHCPFCPERVLTVTPRFPEEILPEGRLQYEDLVLFPNLAPYDTISAVATLGSRHTLAMHEITPEIIVRGFDIAMRFFRHLEAVGHPEAVYPIINWNFMPPSGSSIIHPHFQVFFSADAPELMRRELDAAKAYYDRHGRNFWDDLVAEEKAADKRFLGTIGNTSWMSAWAPMGVAGDVVAVVDGAMSTLDLTTADIADLAEGLTRAMAGYADTGLYSFNMNVFTGRRGDEHSRVHLVFSPRTYFNAALGTPDVGALRNLFNETLCMAFPEDIAEMLRPSFVQSKPARAAD
jgi:UDPglucose--hexose-1-phosphate uridylyltransferase